MALTFTVQLNRDGVVRFKGTVSAQEMGIVGDWYKGRPYQPIAKEVRALIPYHYRKAFDRALKWGQTESMSGRSMPLMCDLTALSGAPMGTLYATPNWVA